MPLREIGRNILAALRNIIHRPRTEISKENVIAAVALLVTAIIALMIRLLPLLGFEILVRAFDPWYNYRETEFIINNGFAAWFGWYDDTTWVPWGRNIPRSSYPGIPFTTALMYFALQFLGIHIDLMLLCVLFPAIMGTAGVIATYFLGRELVNKETGLFAAFFMAILPAYTQRTIAGFFDNEAIGIFATVVCLFFFARSLRKGSIASAILGGLALGYLAASWGANQYIFGLLPLYALLIILLRRYSRRLLVAYTGTVIGGLLIAICVPRIGPRFVYSITGLLPIAVLALMILIEINRSLKLTQRQLPTTLTSTANRLRPYAPYIFGAMCALVVVGLGYLAQSGFIIQLATAPREDIFQGLVGKFYTIIDPLIRKHAYLLASVGEHLPSPWATFWYNLGFLIFIVPFGLYAAFRRESEADMLIIIFTLTTVYFCGSMIRLVLLLAPAASISGAYGLTSLLKPFRTIFWQQPILTRRRRRITPPTPRSFASVTYVLVVILLLSTTITSIHAANIRASPEIIPGSRNITTGESWYRTDYLETFEWMRVHTPPDALFASWWDYGYWIRVVGNRSCVVDNATGNKTQIALVGRMLMERDPIEALRIAALWNIDYVLVHFGLLDPGYSGDEGKFIWMVRISIEVFGDEVPPEETFYVERENRYQEAFFDTLLYNMLFVNATQFANVRDRMNSLGMPEVNPDVNPAKRIFEAFPPVFTSSSQLMKVYAVNYTLLEGDMEIRGAGAYPVKGEPGGTDLLSSIVVEVDNPGGCPFTIDKLEVEYFNVHTEEWVTENIFFTDLTSSTGSLRLEPGESIMLNAKLYDVLKVGTDCRVTVIARGFDPPLNRTVWVPVREAPEYNLSAVLSECYAWDNGTIHVVLENTGEGYCTIDGSGKINDEDVAVANRADRGLVLFSGERITFDLDAADAGVTLAEGEDVTVQFFYMGRNVTVDLTVQSTPPSPSPSFTPEHPLTAGGLLVYGCPWIYMGMDICLAWTDILLSWVAPLGVKRLTP